MRRILFINIDEKSKSINLNTFGIEFFENLLSKRNIITFSKTLQKNEGKKGVVVTLLASLELAKDGYLELIQNKSSELFLKSKGI